MSSQTMRSRTRPKSMACERGTENSKARNIEGVSTSALPASGASVAPPGFGVRPPKAFGAGAFARGAVSAFARATAKAKAPEDWRTPKKVRVAWGGMEMLPDLSWRCILRPSLEAALGSRSLPEREMRSRTSLSGVMLGFHARRGRDNFAQGTYW